MPQKLIDLEQRLRAREEETSLSLRAGVMRAVEGELNQAPHMRPIGWNWAAAGVAVLMLLNLSAVWRMGNRSLLDSTQARRWVMAHRAWRANQKMAMDLWPGLVSPDKRH